MSVKNILVPSGIGDFSWLWSKLVTTGDCFHIEYVGGQPDRMSAFLKLLPKDKVLSYKPNPYYCTMWKNQELICMRNTRDVPQIKKAYKYADLPTDGRMAFMEINTFLEAGNRIELWNREELPRTDFHYNIDGVMAKAVRGDYFIVNFSSHGTKTAWGYYEVPDSALVVSFIQKITGWIPVFIGGYYDDYTKDICRQLWAWKVPAVNLVGKTPGLKEVIALLQQARMYFGACSGLMVLSNIVYTPVCTYYPPFDFPPGKKLASTWHDLEVPYQSLFWTGAAHDLCILDNFIQMFNLTDRKKEVECGSGA